MIRLMLGDLDRRHLQAFVAVAQFRTFARAAEQLGYSQSAVSQQIAGLERAIGATVFDRPGGPRPVELTPVGELLLRHAEAVLARFASAESDISRFLAGQIGQLRVGTFQSAAVELLPRVLGTFRREHPEIDVRLHEVDDPAELTALVCSGELELSFVTGTYDASGLTVLELGRDPFVVVCRAHDDESAGPLARDVLLDGPLIGQNNNACQREIDQSLTHGGRQPSYVFRSNDNAAVQAMVRAGMGRAVMPLLAVDLEDPRVVVRPLEPPIPDRVISLVWRHGRTRSPAAVRFTELVLEACASLQERRALLLARRGVRTL